jgi:mycothiol synthase
MSALRTEPLDASNLPAFLAFCARHRAHLDDSYLTPSELAALPSPEHPTCVAYEGDVVAGAASLVLDDYHLRSGNGRFRILYAESSDPQVYHALLDAVRPAPSRIDSWTVFVRADSADQLDAVLQVGFRVERSSRILIRPPAPIPETQLPFGIEIRPFVTGKDEGVFAEVRNAAFSTLQGSTTPRTPEEIGDMLREAGSDWIGAFLMYENGQPVGVVCGMRDASDETEGPMLEIAPLAILPGRQGRGLGTLLLRHAVRDGAERAGLPKAVLSVNAENAPALGLYLREGFRVVQALDCLRQDL